MKLVAPGTNDQNEASNIIRLYDLRERDAYLTQHCRYFGRRIGIRRSKCGGPGLSQGSGNPCPAGLAALGVHGPNWGVACCC